MSSEEQLEKNKQKILSPSLNFHLEKSPAVSGNINIPKYNTISTNSNKNSGEGRDGSEYIEMDFRNEVESIPSSTYVTHPIHKHPAVFIPQIPRHIIESYTTNRNTDGGRPKIYDPFNGSGTTGVEAKLTGRDYIGVEINPLSKLISDVKTAPLPPTLANKAKSDLMALVHCIDNGYYAEYDPEFLDTTEKERWFETSAIEGLTKIRKALDEFEFNSYQYRPLGLPQEEEVVSDKNLTQHDLKDRIYNWFVLMIANTVFEVSNADPGVSKAYKSKKMKEKIQAGDHPPDPVKIFEFELEKSFQMLKEYWERIYEDNSEINTNLYKQNGLQLENNDKHNAQIDIRLGDSRKFCDTDVLESIDLAVTSPPYVNAMNYYRGTKLRLFWIHDLLNTSIDATKLRRSFAGTNSVSIRGMSDELPKSISGMWTGTKKEYQATTLTKLDDQINQIHEASHSESVRRAYTTWKFFGVDMHDTLVQTYKLLKPGAHFFILIGENTVAGQTLESQKYIADIAAHLEKFDNELDNSYRYIGLGWDNISNRELFQSRNHNSGVIEGEWVLILQKPST